MYMSENLMKKSTKKTFIEVVSTNDISTVVNKIFTAPNKYTVVKELFVFTYNYCEKIQERNKVVFEARVRPRLIKCNHIERKLEENHLTEDQEKNLYEELAIECRAIDEVGKEYYKSLTDKLAIMGGSIVIGSVAGFIFKAIFNDIKK
jgi:hypothetical protein